MTDFEYRPGYVPIEGWDAVIKSMTRTQEKVTEKWSIKDSLRVRVDLLEGRTAIEWLRHRVAELEALSDD